MDKYGKLTCVTKGEKLRSSTTMNFYRSIHEQEQRSLRMVPAKVVARDAKEMRTMQDTRTGFVSSNSGRFQLFLVEKMHRFSTMKNNFHLPCQFFENRRSMRMLLFLRMIDLTEHFIVKQKSILKHQKLLLQDGTLRAWVLKNPLIGKDQ